MPRKTSEIHHFDASKTWMTEAPGATAYGKRDYFGKKKQNSEDDHVHSSPRPLLNISCSDVEDGA